MLVHIGSECAQAHFIFNCVAVSVAQLTVSVGASENMDSNAVTVTLAFSECPMVLKFSSHGGLTWSFML